jgi:hypothetical protein
MQINELIGLGVAIVVLAGVVTVVVNGGKSAAVLQAAANGFAADIRAATLQAG